MARKTKVDMKWYDKEVGEVAMKTLKRNAERTGMFLDGKVVLLLSKGQPAKRVGVKKPRLVGLDPSKPGEPPRLLHGNLRNSITHRVDRGKDYVDVYIGAHTPYARALEFGDPKAASRARGSARKNVTSLASGFRTAGAGMPRPYLRPTIKNNREKAIEIMVRGLFKRKTIGDRRKNK